MSPFCVSAVLSAVKDTSGYGLWQKELLGMPWYKVFRKLMDLMCLREVLEVPLVK